MGESNESVKLKEKVNGAEKKHKEKKAKAEKHTEVKDKSEKHKDKKDKSEKHKDKKDKSEKHKDKKHKKHKDKKSAKPEQEDDAAEQESARSDKSAKSDKSDKPEPASAPGKAAPSPSDVKSFLESNSVSVEVPSGLQALDPVLDIAQVSVQPRLSQFLAKFPKPTPIQSSTWPHLLAGRDVVGVAETGSGKTLAFGVPAVERLTKDPRATCLVISPTRELAMQIDDQFQQLLAPFNNSLGSICLYGGVPKYDQQQQLKRGSAALRIVVGTPGRLRDLIADGSLDLSRCTYLVLDEADRMLEKGFEQDIKEILGCAPAADRQTVMFTATWPTEVRQLASTFMNNQVVKVSIGEVDELHANKRITQYVDVIDQRDKERWLLDLLRKYARNGDKVLVFALYKKEASRIERLLTNKGYAVAAVHGDLNQQQRTRALQDFKTGKSSLMLATDVAARGLDIPAVKVVINLTFPLTVEDYVHRIGRTGRAGQSGIAHTLFTEQEKHLAGALMNVLRDAGQNVPEELMKFGSHTKKKEHSLYGAFFKDVDSSQKAKKIKFD